jgi:hypothetical protein
VKRTPLKPGKPPRRTGSLRRTGGPKRTARREPSAERIAREEFNRVVLAWPCLFTLRPGHVCDGPLDAHHLVPKNFLRHRFSHLPLKQLLAILFDPRIGAPLCRYGAHDPVTHRTAFVYREDLSHECLDFVTSLPSFVLLRLEEECPRRDTLAGGGGGNREGTAGIAPAPSTGRAKSTVARSSSAATSGESPPAYDAIAGTGAGAKGAATPPPDSPSVDSGDRPNANQRRSGT